MGQRSNNPQARTSPSPSPTSDPFHGLKLYDPDDRLNTVTPFRLSQLNQVKALSTLTPYEKVEVPLGNAVTVQYHGGQFQARQIKLGIVPGTRQHFPPTFLLTRSDFAIKNCCGSNDRAQYHPEGIIEAWVGGAELESLPDTLIMRSKELKDLLIALVHEGIHAVGGKEFKAYFGDSMYGHKIRAYREAPDPLEILTRVLAVHEPRPDFMTILAEVQDEFEHHCKKNKLHDALNEGLKRINDYVTDPKLLRRQEQAFFDQFEDFQF